MKWKYDKGLWKYSSGLFEIWNEKTATGNHYCLHDAGNLISRFKKLSSAKKVADLIRVDNYDLGF